MELVVERPAFFAPQTDVRQWATSATQMLASTFQQYGYRLNRVAPLDGSEAFTRLYVGITPTEFQTLHGYEATYVALYEEINMTNVGGAARFIGTRVNTSLAAPSAVTSGQSLAILRGAGYGTSVGTGAEVRLMANGTWTGSSYSSRIDFAAAASGSTSLTVMASFAPAGLTFSIVSSFTAGATITADAVGEFKVQRNSSQYLDISSTATGTVMTAYSTTAATKSLFIRATTDEAGTAGTAEPSILLRGRANSTIAMFVDGEVELNATVLDFNGNLDVSGTSLLTGTVRAAGTTASTTVPPLRVGTTTATGAACDFSVVQAGAVRVHWFNSTNSIEVMTGATTTIGYIGTRSNHNFELWANNAIAATVTTAGNFYISGTVYHNAANNSNITVAGGNGAGNGANIELYGGTHATNADQAYYDASQHSFRSQNAGTGMVTFDTSKITMTMLDIIRSIDTSALRLSGGNVAGTGAFFQLMGSTHATFAGQAYLDATTFFVRNASSTTQIQIEGGKDPVFTHGIKVSGHTPLSNTGAGAELVYSGGVAYFQGYNRTSSTYVPSYHTGSDVYLYAATGNCYFYGNGTHRATMDTGGNWRWLAYGAGTLTTDASGNITAVSDERIKTSIQPYGQGLAAILALEPIAYRYTRESGLDTRGTYIGFSAQQVEGVLPEAIGRMAQRKIVSARDVAKDGLPEAVDDPNDEPLRTFNDRPIIAALVNAVKELSAELAALRGTTP